MFSLLISNEITEFCFDLLLNAVELFDELLVAGDPVDHRVTESRLVLGFLVALV